MCRSKTAWLLGCASVATLLASQSFASAHELSTEWSVRLGPATPNGCFRFSLCADNSIVAYAGPSTLYRIDAFGRVELEQEVEGLQGIRSLDCADVVRVLRVSEAREMQVVEIAPATLNEIRRFSVTDERGSVAAGLRVVDGESLLMLGDPEGAAIGRLEGAAVTQRIGMQLPRPGRASGNAAVVIPLFRRMATGRYVLVQTHDYSVLEFDGTGSLHRVWRPRRRSLRRNGTAFAAGRERWRTNHCSAARCSPTARSRCRW